MKVNQESLPILVVSLSNIGDVVLTTPVMSVLRRSFPNAKIKVMVGPKAESILRGSSTIDEVIIYDKHISWKEKIKLVLNLKRDKYQLVVDLRNTAIPFFLSAKKRSPMLRKYTGGGMRKKHLTMLERTGVQLSEGKSIFNFFSKSEEIKAFDFLKGEGLLNTNFVVFGAGSASDAKRWPIEKFKELGEKILMKTDYSIVLIGDKREHSAVDVLCQINSKRVVNVAGKLSLRESSAVIGACQAIVTNDSAAMHIGHELDRRVVALFGPSDFEKYGREGERFKALRSLPNKEGKYFLDISAEEVFKTLETLLVKEAIRPRT